MQVCCSEQCSLVDACVLFAYTTFPVVLLSLLQWCGFDFKQRAQKTQATLSRRHTKQVCPQPGHADFLPGQRTVDNNTAEYA